jgi:hypothetical protein
MAARYETDREIARPRLAAYAGAMDKSDSQGPESAKKQEQEHETESEPEHHETRFRLVWQVLLFQFKLAADGLRDLLLVPISLGAGILGLLVGGDEPDQYFRRLLRFGRRTDIWINLFGQHRHGPTSDNLVKPLEESVYQSYRRKWPGNKPQAPEQPGLTKKP